MKRFFFAGTVLIVFILGGLLTELDGAAPGSGLIGSEHDFSRIPAGGAVTGLCTFCHTPHQASETLLLQNHTLSVQTFRWCNKNTTRYGSQLPIIPPSYRGPSKVCLGCHSNTVSVGDIRWFDGRPWVGGSTLDSRRHDGAATAEGCIDHPHSDHPTAFPYPYQGQISTYNGVTNDASAAASLNPDPTVSGIRLFREGAGGEVQVGAVAGRAGIECSSCHDPHNGPTVGGGDFLRGSGPICQKCHKD